MTHTREHTSTPPAVPARRRAPARQGRTDADSATVPAWASKHGARLGPAPDDSVLAEVVSSMETAYGTSFAGTRLRVDESAAARADALDAVAYTDGSEIGFAEGAFAPDSAEGLHTIAHEFAHVVQLRGDGGGPPGATGVNLGVGTPARLPNQEPGADQVDAAEAEADAAADAVLAGETPDVDPVAVTGVLTQSKPPANTSNRPPLPVLKPGQYFTYEDKGSRFYIFRLEDAISWGARLKRETLLRYFPDNFDLSEVKDREQFVDEFATQENVGFIAQGGVAEAPPTKPGQAKQQLFQSVEVPADLHARALIWIRLRHPEVKPRHVEEKGATSKPRTGDEKAGEGGFQERKFEPRGELRLNPRPVRGQDDIPAYVAYSDLTSTSAVTANVHFDESDPDRNMLNYFPNHADFDWKLTKGDKVVDTGPLIKYGEISRKLKLPDPGLYTVKVTVTSPYFTGGRKLELEEYLWALKEAQRAADVFNQYLVGDDPDLPFTRAPDGTLQVKAGRPVKTIEDEILELNAMIAAIERLKKDGRLEADDADIQLKYLGEKLTSLEKVKGEVGTDKAGTYLVQGTFVSREDSSIAKVSAVMQRTKKAEAAGIASYGVTLYDFTLSTTDPVRHIGEATSQLGSKTAADTYPDLEATALQAMADHWHLHNDYAYGTVNLAVSLLEKPGLVRTFSIDTYNAGRTGIKVASGVAAVGGVVLIGFSAFTGGATAPVGILILEGVTIAAGAAAAIYNINERYQKGTLKPDAQLVLDLMAFVPVLGTVSKWLGASRALLNGMLFVSLGATAVAMTIATRNELIAVEARYNAAREPIETKLKAAQASGDSATADSLQKQLDKLRHDRDVQVAQVIGNAAVSGGLLLIQFGVSAAQAARPGALGRPDPKVTVEPKTVEPKVTEPSTTEPKVTDPKVTEPSTTEPKVTDPKVTDPKVTDPNVTEPSTTEPKTTEPSTNEPKTTDPKTTEPPPVDKVEPKTTEPSTTEPSTTEPKVTEPPTVKPKVTEPSATEPKTTEPKTTEPKTTEPKPADEGTTPAPKGTKPAPTPEEAMVEQRKAELKAIEDEIAAIEQRRAEAAAKNLAERDALAKEAIAKKAKADALDRQAKATSDPEKRAALEEQAAKAREEWEAARDKQLENQDAVEAEVRNKREAEARREEAQENLKLAEAGRRLSDTKAVTDRLTSIVDDVAAKVDDGTIPLDPGDAKAAASGKMNRAVARGNAIDKAAKAAILADPNLEGLKVTPRGGAGPDIYDKLTNRWWDITTPEEWPQHVKDYTPTYGKGTLLPTRPPKP